MDRLFHALADATRRDIVMRSLQDPHSVSSLAQGYEMSFAAVQKHVAVLERAGLVTKQRRGREQLVRGNVDAVRDIGRLLEQFEDVWRRGMTGSARCSPRRHAKEPMHLRRPGGRGRMDGDPAVQAGIFSYELHGIRSFPGSRLA